jgi:hypothetical protein
MASHYSSEQSPLLKQGVEVTSWTISAHVETLRIFTYVAFWVMCGLAVVLTRAFVTVDLDHSALIGLMGYNNICVYWDYEPARSIVALYYPIVECGLILYCAGHFIRSFLAYREGQISQCHLYAQVTLSILSVWTGLWFRMIFVEDVTINPHAHVAGFLSLQACLGFVEISNFSYLRSTHEWALADSWFAIIWFTAEMGIVGTKFIIGLFLTLGEPLLDGNTPTGATAGRAIDTTWMIMNAVCPLIFAILWRRSNTSRDVVVASFVRDKLKHAADEI